MAKAKERCKDDERSGKGAERSTCFLPWAKDLGRYSARSCAQAGDDGAAEEGVADKDSRVPPPSRAAEWAPMKEDSCTHITLPSGPMTAMPVATELYMYVVGKGMSGSVGERRSSTHAQRRRHNEARRHEVCTSDAALGSGHAGVHHAYTIYTHTHIYTYMAY